MKEGRTCEKPILRVSFHRVVQAAIWQGESVFRFLIGSHRVWTGGRCLTQEFGKERTRVLLGFYLANTFFFFLSDNALAHTRLHYL